MLTLPQYILHVQEVQVRKEASTYKLHKHRGFEGVGNTSKWKEVGFAQKPPNAPSGVSYSEGDKG